MARYWFPEEIEPIMKELIQLLGGHPPFIQYIDDANPAPTAGIHLPTYYPEIWIPHKNSADWTGVAFGLRHLILIMKGVPELRVHGNSADKAIAADINSELHHIDAAKCYGALPRIHSTSLLNEVRDYVESPHTDEIPAYRTFLSLRLQRLRLEGHPDADRAIKILGCFAPDALFQAILVMKYIDSINLSTASGYSQAAMKIVDLFNFDQRRFFFRTTQFGVGTHAMHSPSYFSTLDNLRKAFTSRQHYPGTWLKFQLPFAIPVPDGVYSLNGYGSLIRKVRVQNSRNRWTLSEDAVYDTIMSPRGLYYQTVVELSILDTPDFDDANPPEGDFYKNFTSYSTGVRKVVEFINNLIAAVRVSWSRCDVPEITPADLNELEIKQFDSSGSIIIHKAIYSTEYGHLSGGAPSIENEISSSPIELPQPSFWRELIESAKFHLLAMNPRRAVLDFCGGFEAFVDQYITPRLNKTSENTKDQFLRRYGPLLSDDLKSTIRNLSLPEAQDPVRHLPVRRLLDSYRHAHESISIDREKLGHILKVFDWRNVAAHGGEIDANVIQFVSNGIDGLEAIAQPFELNHSVKQSGSEVSG